LVAVPEFVASAALNLSNMGSGPTAANALQAAPTATVAADAALRRSGTGHLDELRLSELANRPRMRTLDAAVQPGRDEVRHE